MNEEDLLSPCRISFKFLNKAMEYAQYHFQNKLWNKNEMLEYLRTCCFSKSVAFNAVVAFQQGQEYNGPDVWQKYEEFCIDILDFADTPMHLLYLGIKKYIISIETKIETEPTLWKISKHVFGLVQRECS